MKFTITKEKIQETFSKIGKILNAKSSIPILSGVLVQAQADCLLFTASDGTESMIHRVPILEDGTVSVEAEGSAVFSKESLDVARKLKGTISFELKDTMVEVSQDKTTLEFSAMPAEEFPNVAVEPNSTPIVFSGEEFLKVVSKTTFAAAKEENRPILQGVYMSLGKEGNLFVATDSHRLAQVNSGAFQEEIQVTVPAKTLEHGMKSFDLSQDIMFFPSQLQIALANGNTIFYSRLLEGNYPDTSRLIPSDFTENLVVNRQEFMEALEILVPITTNGVVRLTVDGLFVELTALGETSRGSKQIAFESYDGKEEFEINFSAQYVIDALKALGANSITIGFCGNMKPFVIKPVTEDTNELQLVLPVRG